MIGVYDVGKLGPRFDIVFNKLPNGLYLCWHQKVYVCLGACAHACLKDYHSEKSSRQFYIVKR